MSRGEGESVTDQTAFGKSGSTPPQGKGGSNPPLRKNF